MSLRTLLSSIRQEKFIIPSEEQMKIRRQIADKLEEDIEEFRKEGFSYYLENTPRRFDLAIGKITWLQAIFMPKSARFVLESKKDAYETASQSLLENFQQDLLKVFEDEIPQINFCNVEYYLVALLKIKELHENRKKVFEIHICEMTGLLAQMLRDEDVQFTNYILRNLCKSTHA